MSNQPLFNSELERELRSHILLKIYHFEVILLQSRKRFASW